VAAEPGTAPAAGLTAPGDTSVLADRLRLALVRLSRELRRQDPPGLSVTLYSALATIADRGDLGIGELAEAEGVPPSAATRIADRLEETGLLARQRNPRDRRGVNLAITAEGRALVDNRRARGNAWLASRLSELTPAQRGRLAEALDMLDSAVLRDEKTRAATGAVGAAAEGGR
jgi:DNA-binding MarR family transcriptional regulator